MTNPVEISFGKLFLSYSVEGSNLYSRLAPGTAEWLTGIDLHVAALDFVCPCGCQSIASLPIREGYSAKSTWKWDGDLLRPTLIPSIQRISPCKWHGYLTDGIFKPC